MSIAPTRTLTLAALVTAVACSPAEPSDGRDAARAALAHRAARHAPVIVPLSTPYRVVPVPSYGRLLGVVAFAGDAPADSVTHVTTDADVCGASMVDVSIRTHGSHVAGAVVWLDGVTAGKHLPYTRRFDIVTQGCRLIPRVQTAVAGGTLDVRSADPTTHRTRFAHDSVVVITVPETEDGQVVPAEGVLTAPGLLNVRCENHPWTLGWVAVFDHPYYTMTGDDGQFSVDSVPPGRYRIMAWHERFGVVADSITVERDVETSVMLTFRRPAHP